MDNKNKIIKLFDDNVKGKPINIVNHHDGSEGHWLETQMGIKHNNKNAPDIFGYEMKKNSKKITFGDFSATEYLFSKNKPKINKYNIVNIDISRNQYIHYFGTKKESKNNRYSWSGSCVPKFGEYNQCGQILLVNEDKDIYIVYSYEHDTRENKNTLPEFIKTDNKLIALWDHDKMEHHINNKFNNEGFFICEKVDDVYKNIYFGLPFNYDQFINGIITRSIYFDSGMYEGNTRNYSQFRSNKNNFWSSLIIEEH
jgi:hypothetical protein